MSGCRARMTTPAPTQRACGIANRMVPIFVLLRPPCSRGLIRPLALTVTRLFSAPNTPPRRRRRLLLGMVPFPIPFGNAQ